MPFSFPGGLLCVMDGDGDDRARFAPFVWMPCGMGRLALPAAWPAAVDVGAICGCCFCALSGSPSATNDAKEGRISDGSVVACK